MILEIPDDLRDEFSTFLEAGLDAATAYSDELTPNEKLLAQILEDFLQAEADNENDS